MTQVKLKIKKGDKVVIISGRDKGLQGEVVRTIPARRRVVVRGANMVSRHNKPSMRSGGGIEKIEAPIHVSNVAVVDPKEDRPTRVGYRWLENGKKVRFAKKSGEVIE